MKLELPGGAAVDMFKALDSARGRDRMRTALLGVSWKIAGGVHSFTTTDSFRMHNVTLNEKGSLYDGNVILDSEILNVVKACAKAAGKGNTVVLEIEDKFSVLYCNVFIGTVREIGAPSLFGTVSTINNEFPECSSIVDRSHETDIPALFNGQYLGALVDAAALWAGKDSPITVESIHATKPSRIVSANDYGTFTGLVMPQRGGE
jgi:DNA polymerase III sliding clamp (beta) subunit (PCNA family)